MFIQILSEIYFLADLRSKIRRVSQNFCSYINGSLLEQKHIYSFYLLNNCYSMSHCTFVN